MTYDKDSFLAGLSVGMSLRYSKRIPAPPSCLTFSSQSPFTLSIYNSTKNWNGTLEYSTDAATWATWGGTTTLTAVAKAGTYYLYLRGTGNTVITGNLGRYRWVINGASVYCDGDIRTLLDYANPESTTMADYCYYMMFSYCTSLVTAPALPAATLSRSCYAGMFDNCANLTIAPELPSATLAYACYANMFRNCTSLMVAPALTSLTLADRCYISMFTGCTNLTSIPKLAATMLTENCYNAMFSGCINIKLSETQIGIYQIPYRIPTSGTGASATDALLNMFANTGGTFTGQPTINTTYYTSNQIV